MRARERRERILAELTRGAVDVAALCAGFGVSESTIRRDLRHLSEAGYAQRTYGGAVPARVAGEPTVDEKRERQVAAKQAIAAEAAALVEDGDCVALDAGTTTAWLAWELRHKRELTVVTNGLGVLEALWESDACELHVLGGTVRAVSQALLGPMTEHTLRLVRPRRAFVGADGVDPQHGVSCPSLVHSSWKQALAASCWRVTVLADATKLGHAPFDFWAPMPPGTTVITDGGVGAAQREAFAAGPFVLRVAGGEAAGPEAASPAAPPADDA